MSEFSLTRTEYSRLPRAVEELLENALSENTRRAYRADVTSFLAWGGTIPSTPEQLSAFIADTAHHLSVPTIRRHLSALSFTHETLALHSNPTRDPLVRTALKGAARLYGTNQRGVEPLLVEDLRMILEAIDDTVVGQRSKALLCLGFAGGFRRSELIGLNCEDIRECPEGLVVKIRKSKTDQAQHGRVIGIPFARGKWCPVSLIKHWTALLPDEDGPLFRACQKGGNILGGRLSSEAVAITVKSSVKSIGLDPSKYSAHSLRAGFVTSAIKSGAPSHLVRLQTGHASDATMARYIRLGNLFSENAVSWVL